MGLHENIYGEANHLQDVRVMRWCKSFSYKVSDMRLHKSFLQEVGGMRLCISFSFKVSDMGLHKSFFTLSQGHEIV